MCSPQNTASHPQNTPFLWTRPRKTTSHPQNTPFWWTRPRKTTSHPRNTPFWWTGPVPASLTQDKVCKMTFPVPVPPGRGHKNSEGGVGNHSGLTARFPSVRAACCKLWGIRSRRDRLLAKPDAFWGPCRPARKGKGSKQKR